MANRFYFTHDINAMLDPKILEMRCDYGMEGYGVYWAILEMLGNEESYTLPLNKSTFKSLKTLCNTTFEIEKFIYDCIEYGLFVNDDKFFWSNSFLQRMARKNEIRKKRKKAIESRWDNDKSKISDEYKIDTNELQMNEVCNTNEIQMNYKLNSNVIQKDTNKKRKEKRENRKGKIEKEKENKKQQQEKEKERVLGEGEEKTSLSSLLSSSSFPDSFAEEFTEIINILTSEGFGISGGIFAQMVEELIRDYTAIWVKEAIKIAVSENKRKLRYISGILENWRKEGGVNIGKDRGNKLYTNKGTGAQSIIDEYKSMGIDITGESEEVHILTDEEIRRNLLS
jgi:hypothetical protein